MKFLRWLPGPKQVIWSVLAVLSVLSVLAVLWKLNGVPVSNADVLKRKNIDDLSTLELQAYEHAIQILKDRSEKNAYDKTGYLWQAWVHNCPFIWRPENGSGKRVNKHPCDSIRSKPGPNYDASHPGQCEHGKDMFLPWHRAMIYFFEKLLQAADPDGTVIDGRGITGPSTKNVTIPYWNWTRKPSGVRYPKALEDKNSPLYHTGRNYGPPTNLEEVTNPYAIAYEVRNLDWKFFGGFRQEDSVGGYGDFETIHHNPMHTRYFGGDMESNSTAALDPGFFNFHAYIDLLFDFWLKEHGRKAVTSKKHFLRADQPESVDPPLGYERGEGGPSMGRVGIYFDTEKSLGYVYEVKPEDRLPDRKAVQARLAGPDGNPALFGQTDKSAFARLSGDGLFEPDSGSATMIESRPVIIPQSVGEPNSIVATLNRGDGPDVSYTVDVYLHPKATEFDAGDKEIRNRYVVMSGGYLGTGADTPHQDAKPYFADLTGPVRDLIATGHAGKEWRVTVVVSGQPPTPDFATVSVSTN